MKLVIIRSKWLRGERPSYLLRQRDRKMCCLGFLGLACGLTKENILNVKIPVRPILGKSIWPKGIFDGIYDTLSSIAKGLVLVNDDITINDSTREKKIKELFSKIDVEAEFVD